MTYSIPIIVLSTLILSASTVFGAPYLIEPGDQLLIAIIDQTEYNQSVTVRGDGKISYFGGDLEVGGKTPEAVNRQIQEFLFQQKQLKNPLLMVSPIPREREIFVGGAVNQPGRYPLQFQDELGLERAIAIAGGPTKEADLKTVQVVRKDGTIEPPYDLSPGKPYQPIVIRKGDLVRVPALGVVNVQGQVNQPGEVLIRRRIRIDEALARAGGTNENAEHSTLIIMRSNGEQTQVRLVEKFWELPDSDNPGYYLEDGDALYVPTAYKVEEIYVIGYVRNPGLYKIRGPVTPLQAIALAGGLDESANDEKAQLVRKDETRQEINLEPKADQPENRRTVLLYPGDMLIISKRRQINWSLIFSALSATTVIVSFLTRQ
jgi:protein involved in polysaccharide export with SLBB domain